MPANISILTLSPIASGDVIGGRGISFDGAQATTQGEKILGVSDSSATNGQSFPAVSKGTAIMESGAAVALGDALIVDNQGRAIPAAGAPGEFVFADALQATAGAGALIEILMR